MNGFPLGYEHSLNLYSCFRVSRQRGDTTTAVAVINSVDTVGVLHSARPYRKLKIQFKNCSTECTKPALLYQCKCVV
jgi:hypothetical protein